MARHPKSFAPWMLIDVEDKAEIFAMTMLEIFGLGADTLPLHLKIGLWQAELIRTNSKTGRAERSVDASSAMAL